MTAITPPEAKPPGGDPVPTDDGTLPPLREVIARHGLAARRALGQHFLLDGNLTARIARAAGALTDCVVVEIGPGPGGLTRALLAAGAGQVIGIEKDERCIAALETLRAHFPDRLHILTADARDIDVVAVARRVDGRKQLKIIANLPYNVATPLLIGWLRNTDGISEMVLMFQKEVAQRLCAPPGSRRYGRLSVLAQWRCRVARLFDIPGRAFVPPPRVDSTVMRLTPRREPLAPAPLEALERVTAAAFGQRRKMLRSSLKALGIDVGAFIAAADINPETRAERLDVVEFCALARILAEGEA